MMEMLSLICRAVTAAVFKVHTLRWALQWAHYGLWLNEDSLIRLFLLFIVFSFPCGQVLARADVCSLRQIMDI